MKTTLKNQARALRLSGLLQGLEVRLQEARGNDLAHDEFLELIFNDELNVRGQRQIERRTKAAGFREARTLEDFDFGFNPKITAASSTTSPPAPSSTRAATCSWSALPAWARATSPRPSDTP